MFHFNGSCILFIFSVQGSHPSLQQHQTYECELPPSCLSTMASQASLLALDNPLPKSSLAKVTNASDASQPINDVSHEIQIRYKLAPPTLRTMCTISRSPTRRDVLQKACFATEFRSFPIKQAEKGFLGEINDHTGIPYPIKESPSQPWHKAFLLVQIDLQCRGWPSKISANTRKELHQERGRIYALLDRVLRCLIDILGERRDGRGVSVALDVLRSVKSGV